MSETIKRKIIVFIILLFSFSLYAAEDKISVNFKDADIRTVISSIAKTKELNVIIPPTISGKISIYLKDVTFEDAMKNITEASGITYKIDNNILYVNKVGESSLGDAEDFFYYPRYINLQKLSEILKNYISSNAKIVIDDTSGALIITDTKTRLNKLKEIIAKVDKPLKQVLIEAKIVEMSKSGSRDLGIQWGANYSPSSTSYYFPNSVSVGGGASGYMVNLPVTEPAGALNILLGSATGSLLLDVRLQALEKSGEAKIVSEPKIVTMNNQQAHIESGVEFKYKVTTTDTTDIEEDEAKLLLTVTPQVTPDNNILLNVQVEKSELDFTREVDGYPLKITRKAETYLMVKNGETTIIGGLNQKSTSNSNSAVPYLSKIPLLGTLFKSQSKASTLDELMIFITPKIIVTGS
ncbi:hypothetical protein LF845_10175 [Deferribacterales bacterium Es71-Z0220]|uniref:secretin N-terminal domain-containing protein n=1 Tax=Deferrivibrio essentukiensis TaxID=2880922 RepID=UPI001F61405D|nr:secretin N-terminal domain-containing protein [Deferrivibrio essentukiensis]MCB4205322.1 hypothetical protein [Deferrivibrio essentukiensis]